MHKDSDLLGREVFSQDAGEKMASVEEVIFDDDTHRVVALLVDGGFLRNPRVVRRGSVASVADVVAVRGDGALGGLDSDPLVSALRRRSHEIEGKEVITEGGEKIGEAFDLFIGDSGDLLGYEIKSGFVKDLMGRKFVPVEKVRSSGGDAIIAVDAGLPSADVVARR